MNQVIPILILNISDQLLPVSINENSDINDPEVVEEVLKYIGKAGYCKIKDILLFILLGLINQNILNPDDPTIHLRLSDDGQNVGKKVKHIMITCAILNDITNIQKSNYHYTVILYPGTENYKILQKVMIPIVDELNDLVINGLKDSTGKIWKIKPYFSSDWKFLAIILGFNASNANYICPWYLCTKKDIGNKNKVCIIEKNMNQLDPVFFNHNSLVKPSPGHVKPPLLKIIPLDHYIADELHIMLRI
jgi:hypothetical protein